MKLLEVQVNNFRNIIDSSPVKIQDDITCFVGKNESGKTSFLHALYRLNPVRPNVQFSIQDQYPAWLEKKDRMRGVEMENVSPISAIFEIDLEASRLIKEIFGEGVLRKTTLSVSKTYSNQLLIDIDLDLKTAIKNIFKDISLTKETRTEIFSIDYDCIQSLKKKVTELKFAEDNEKDKGSIEQVKERIKTIYGDKTLFNAVWESLGLYLPKFIYFDKYSTLPYTIKIKELLNADTSSLKDDELTALALLKMAGAEDDYLMNPDYERRKRELENVANALTQDVLKYWSQNRELRVSPDITLKTEKAHNGNTAVIDELKIRIWDNRHHLSLPFNEHSSGFQWFFSFLAAFSEFEYSKENIIILLDEPGLGLHGRAQADFLRFIEDRLADSRQVLYTTHSPFLVQPDHLDRARIVEDNSQEIGCRISSEVLSTDPDTLFPLQGALGYDLAQHLFISKNNLILEGISDFIYLSVLSRILSDQGKQSLDERWSLIPVGGADLIPTFVALLGNHLDVTVLIDSRKEGNQKLSNLSTKGYLNGKRLVTIGEVLNKRNADIEDLFELGDYLMIFNGAFKRTLTESEVKGTDPIVNRIARLDGIDRFDHGKPADFLLRNQIELLPKFSQKTLNNFENLIIKINQTINQ